MTPQTPDRLPLGIHSFPRLADGSFRFVDKRGYAEEVVNEGGKRTLHLPKGWGKTLFISMIEVLYRTSYPVIRLDFGYDTLSPGALRDHLSRQLHDIEIVDDPYAGLGEATIERRLESLIRRRCSDWARRVILLIDNYDTPMARPSCRPAVESIIDTLSPLDDQIHLLLLAGTGEYATPDLEFLPVDPAASGFTIKEAQSLMSADSSLSINDLAKRAVTLPGCDTPLLSPFETVFLLTRPGAPLPERPATATAIADDIAISKMRRALLDDAPDDFLTLVKSILAATPYQHFPTEKKEGFNHARIDLIARMIADSQIVCHSELQNYKGRIDMVIETPATVYIFEFKHDKTAAEALSQIRRQGYPLPYLTSGKRIFAIGVNFSADSRGIADWLINEIHTPGDNQL